MSRVHVFTSAAFNYIPKARLLFSALRRHHPEWTLHLALGDRLFPEFKLDNEPFDEIMPLADLGIPHWHGWAFCHSIVELCTAIKPFALRQLLSIDGCEKVLYFDPDMVAFSRLDDLLHALDNANVLLTPHLVDPETDLTAVIDNEICSLRHGVYNLGFVGVKNSEEGRRFADWWASRVYHFCRDDIPNGLFTDQRWIDLVPAFFEGVAVMRSHRHNVATWNLTTRILSGGVETGLMVDGDPLGFYHFTGFDSGAHAAMAKKNAGGSPAVFDLIRWYQDQTKNLGQDPLAQVRWGYDTFSNGEKISLAQRIVYRQRIDLQAAYPDPFDSTGYLQWWKATAAREFPELSERSGTGRALPQIASMLTIGYCAGTKPLQDRSLADFELATARPPAAFEILATDPEMADVNYRSALAAARRRIAEMEYGRREAQAKIDAIYASASWRLTAPMRYLGRLLVPVQVRPMMRLLSGRNIRTAVRYVRQGQFKLLLRQTLSAASRNAPFDSPLRRAAETSAPLRYLARLLVPRQLRLVPRQVRSMIRLVSRRRIATALRYVRHGQFNELYRHTRGAMSRNAPADDLSPLVITEISLRDPAKPLQGFQLLHTVAHLAEKRTVLIVDHQLGGGANLYRERLVRQYAAQEHPILLLTYEYRAKRMRLHFSFREYKIEFVLISLDDLVQLSQMISFGEVFYNNAVSFSDPLAVAEALPRIKNAAGAKLTVAFHDYFLVCPSFTLINSEGRYCEIPTKFEACQRCLEKNKLELVDAPDGGILRWRETWGGLITNADTVLCFSEDTARSVRKAYPQAGSKILIRPHQVDYLPLQIPQVDLGANLHIGVIGSISFAKGAEVVRRVAEFIEMRQMKVRITIVGTIRHDKELPRSVRVTGPYTREKLAKILEREGINMCFLPSICPETFSYVTEELMQLKMPLCCFDLGAPADRVRTYQMGCILSSVDDPAATLDEIIAFHNDLCRADRNKALVEFSILYGDKPISGAMQIIFNVGIAGAARLHGQFRGGRDFVYEIKQGCPANFSIGVNSHLLPNGPVEASFMLLDNEGTNLWSGATTVNIDNTSLLAEKVRKSMIRWDTPLIVESFHASQYGFHDTSLAPWFDRPNANEYIDDALEGQVISVQEAEMLRAFVVDGFLVMEDAIEDALIQRINSELDDVAAKKLQGYTAGSSQRIQGLHLVYPGIRELWQHPRVMRVLELIFNEKPRPCQTLTYIFGSQQDAHQDTIHLTPFPAGNMCGVWVAIEDVRPNSGELEVFRRSHRFPRLYMDDCGCAKVVDNNWNEFGEKVVTRWANMIAENKPERIAYRPMRGTVLIWHENLMHAGSKRVDMALSRRSIVSHVFADGAVAFYDSTGNAGYMQPVDRLSKVRGQS